MGRSASLLHLSPPPSFRVGEAGRERGVRRKEAKLRTWPAQSPQGQEERRPGHPEAGLVKGSAESVGEGERQKGGSWRVRWRKEEESRRWGRI